MAPARRAEASTECSLCQGSADPPGNRQVRHRASSGQTTACSVARGRGRFRTVRRLSAVSAAASAEQAESRGVGQREASSPVAVATAHAGCRAEAEPARHAGVFSAKACGTRGSLPPERHRGGDARRPPGRRTCCGCPSVTVLRRLDDWKRDRPASKCVGEAPRGAFLPPGPALALMDAMCRVPLLAVRSRAAGRDGPASRRRARSAAAAGARSPVHASAKPVRSCHACRFAKTPVLRGLTGPGKQETPETTTTTPAVAAVAAATVLLSALAGPVRCLCPRPVRLACQAP
jgi:hypothetical protein